MLRRFSGKASAASVGHSAHLILLGQQSLRESLCGAAIDLARTRGRLGQLVEVRDPA